MHADFIFIFFSYLSRLVSVFIKFKSSDHVNHVNAWIYLQKAASFFFSFFFLLLRRLGEAWKLCRNNCWNVNTTRFLPIVSSFPGMQGATNYRITCWNVNTTRFLPIVSSFPGMQGATNYRITRWNV